MDYKENLVNKFKETFKEVAGNTSDSEVMKTNLRGSFLSMKYTDYFFCFLQTRR